MEKFTIGLLVGALGGALLAANSRKTRMMIKQSQEGVKEKFDEMWEEKRDVFCEKTGLCPSENSPSENVKSDKTTGAGLRSTEKAEKAQKPDRAEKRAKKEEKKNLKAAKAENGQSGK